MEQRRCFGCMNLTSSEVCERCGWSAGQNNESHQLPVGTILAGKYLVGRALGQGGFGITYLGWDLNLDIRVCIKEFFPSSTVNRDHGHTCAVTCNTTMMEAGYVTSRERFLREAKSLAQFRNVPQIVSIFDFFQANNTAYMVMEYVEGINMAKYVQTRGGRIGMDETLRILKPVMEALARVHKAGLIHRDIAPDNIMLDPRDGAKLLDFGAVRQVENPDAEKELNRSTEAILKSGFAPMEQYLARGSLGPWTDVYAFSATIYYCVTGRIPPEAPARMLEGAPLDWSGAQGITRRQMEVLEHGMALRAADRIASMEELMGELYSPEAAPRRPEPPKPEPPKPEPPKPEPPKPPVREEDDIFAPIPKKGLKALLDSAGKNGLSQQAQKKCRMISGALFLAAALCEYYTPAYFAWEIGWAMGLKIAACVLMAVAMFTGIFPLAAVGAGVKSAVTLYAIWKMYSRMPLYPSVLFRILVMLLSAAGFVLLLLSAFLRKKSGRLCLNGSILALFAQGYVESHVLWRLTTADVQSLLRSISDIFAALPVMVCFALILVVVYLCLRSQDGKRVRTAWILTGVSLLAAVLVLALGNYAFRSAACAVPAAFAILLAGLAMEESASSQAPEKAPRKEESIFD